MTKLLLPLASRLIGRVTLVFTVYIVGASAKIQQRLLKLGLFDPLRLAHILVDRTEALQ